MANIRNTHNDAYLELSKSIRDRFESIEKLLPLNVNYNIGELIAYQGRKITESIGYLILIAHDKKFNKVPKECKGKYKPHDILKNLKKKSHNGHLLPEPSIITSTTPEEKKQYNAKIRLDSKPEYKLAEKEIEKIYNRFSSWSHELNPFNHKGHSKIAFFNNNKNNLVEDVTKLKNFIKRHSVVIQGEGFYCTLWDSEDNQTKVISISKVSDL